MANRKIVEVVPLSQGLERPTSVGDFPTLGELFRRADEARADGAEVVLSVDARDAHPLRVTFNGSAASVDGAICFTVTEYHLT
ncbi:MULTISPECIES: hypothetical protein [unclassified Micromonospora]|uniref:hypothetical protein n=1 Tax=unclassified Micromonospora TaxID=2617518 RepID=UPI002FF3ED33